MSTDSPLLAALAASPEVRPGTGPELIAAHDAEQLDQAADAIVAAIKRSAGAWRASEVMAVRHLGMWAAERIVRDLADSSRGTRRMAAAGQAPVPAVVSPPPGPAESVCICGHPEQQHFEDVCLTGCGCGDFLPVAAAAEEIARLRQIIGQKPTDRADAAGPAPAPNPTTPEDVRLAAIRAVEQHPSTTFMAPCESLADAVLEAVLPLLAGTCDAGISHAVHCSTPETHNWGCGCPTDQAPAPGTDGLRERIRGALLEADTYAQLEKRVDRERFVGAVMAVLADRRPGKDTRGGSQPPVGESTQPGTDPERPLTEDEIAEAVAHNGGLTVFRASHDSIPLDLYTTREAAREHCETHMRLSDPDRQTLHWIPDHGGDDAPEDLAYVDGDGDSVCSGYTVTPLTVATAYDPDGEDEDYGSIEDVYSASELHEMDQAAEFAMDAADDAANTAAVEADERGDA